MKRKMISLFCVICVVMTMLVGCSGVGAESGVTIDDEDVATGSVSYADMRIGISIYQLSDNFMSLFSQELINYLLSYGFSKNNIIVYGSANNEKIQLSQIQELIDKEVDALIVNPVNSDIAESITDTAKAGGIPVVYINREPDADEENRWEDFDIDACYVGCDARQSGIYQGELLLDIGEDILDINGDGRIQYYMIEGASENIDAAYRTMFSLSTLEGGGFEMECLLDECGNWNQATAELIVQNGLSQGLIPEFILCNNDAMALGAVSAVSKAGLNPGEDVYVVGVDALSDALELIIDGKMAGTVFNDFITQARSAADAALNYIEGESVEHYIGCDYIKVDRTNAETILSMISNLRTTTSVEYFSSDDEGED